MGLWSLTPEIQVGALAKEINIFDIANAQQIVQKTWTLVGIGIDLALVLVAATERSLATDVAVRHSNHGTGKSQGNRRN